MPTGYRHTSARIKRRRLTMLLFAGPLASSGGSLLAADVSWSNPSGGNFSDGPNWTGGVPAGPSDNAVFAIGGSTPYTTTFTGATQTAQLTISGAPITFNLSTNQYSIQGTSTLSNGTLAVASGTLQTAFLYLDSSSVCTISSSGNVAVNTFEYIGQSGAGTSMLTQSSGSNIITGFVHDPDGNASLGLAIAGGSGSPGSYTLSGGTLTSAYYESIGENGNGTFTQTGGDNNCATDIVVAHLNSSVGTYNFSGGTVEAATLAVGDYGNTTSAFNLSGTGALTVSGIEAIGNNANSKTSTIATFNQSGGSNQGGNLALGNSVNAFGSYNLSAGSMTFTGAMTLLGSNSSFHATGGTATFGSVSNVSSVIVGPAVGPSPAASMVVHGNYNQSSGTTQIDGSLTVSPAQFGFFLAGGVLKGTGNIAATIVNTGGSIIPGDSPGELNVTGNYQQRAGGSLNILIGGYAPGLQYDVLNLSGSAALNGTLNLTYAPGFVPQPGAQFEILESSSISGAFATINSTYAMNISYAGGNVVVTSVPEPSALLLAGIGAGVLVRRRRRGAARPFSR